MKFQELQPGKYKAWIKDWGLEEIPKLGNKLKVVIQFDIEYDPQVAEFISARWEGFLENKDGVPNKNTIKTLVTCGFAGDDPMALTTDSSALDNQAEYQVTVIKDGEYTKIQWVNVYGAQDFSIKKVQPKGKTSQKLRLAFQEARGPAPKKKIKNHAPGADDDSLPF